MGLDLRAGIRLSFRNAILRKTYLVDGEIAAMTGLCGGLVSDIGYPYFITTSACDKVPFRVASIARRTVGDMLAHRKYLEGRVDANYTRAVRFLWLLGFELSEPEHFGSGLFRKFTMARE